MSTTHRPQRPKPPDPLLSARAALVLALSIFCGIGAGLLTYCSTRDTARAVLTGCGTAAGAVLFWNRVIGT